MENVYEVEISDTDNQECFAELPTTNGSVEFNLHIRKCFGRVFLDVYVDGENVVASALCLPNRYVFGYGGYAMYYKGENTFEWKHYDLA